METSVGLGAWFCMMRLRLKPGSYIGRLVLRCSDLLCASSPTSIYMCRQKSDGPEQHLGADVLLPLQGESLCHVNVFVNSMKYLCMCGQPRSEARFY